jgi:hypothetical protein
MTQPSGNIFDQAAASLGMGSEPSSSQPSQQASQPASPAPAQPAQPANGGGNIFDQAAASLPDNGSSFQAPASGHTITPGQIVNLNGHAGVAKGINPKTGKMIVDWGSKPRWNPFSAPEEITSEVSTGDLNNTVNNGASGNAASFVAGTGSKLTQTVQGAVHIAHRVDAAAGVHPQVTQNAENTLAGDQQQLTTAKNANPLAGGAGSLAGDVLEFLAGGEALKPAEEALSSSELMAQAGKITKAVEKFPRLAKALQTGLKAGAIQGGIGTVNSGGDLGTGLEQGLATGATAGLGSLAAQVAAPYVKSIPQVFRNLFPPVPDALSAEAPDAAVAENPQPVYDTVHQGIRNILNNALTDSNSAVVGPEAPVPTTEPLESIRDAVPNAADATRANAKDLYGQMDNVLKTMSDSGEDLPGRFQKFDEDIEKINDKIADAIGEPEKQAGLDEALQQVKANRAVAVQKLVDAGVPANLPDQASAMWMKGRALDDLGKAVQSSTDGTLPKLAQPGSAPERINIDKLTKQVYGLYNSTKYGGRRLVQALGEDNAHDLMSLLDNGKIALNQIDERAATNVATRATHEAVQKAALTGNAADIAAAQARRAKTLGLLWKVPVGLGIVGEGVNGAVQAVKHFIE